MDIPEELHCLFSADIESQDDSYFIEIPKQELQIGDLDSGDSYRVAILSTQSSEAIESVTSENTLSESDRDASRAEPPVEEGDQRKVEIESLGDQGDGITRVERGFVVIVPDTDRGERVSVQITDVRENVAFAEVVERSDHSR